MDRVAVISGVFEGRTTGAPICLVVYNRDVDSSPYEDIKDLFRPGHGDFTWHRKYGIRDWRGGGRLSGRETVARVAAGAFAGTQLRKGGIEVYGFVREIGGVEIKKFTRSRIDGDPLYCPDAAASRVDFPGVQEQWRMDDKTTITSWGGGANVIFRKVRVRGDPYLRTQGSHSLKYR